MSAGTSPTRSWRTLSKVFGTRCGRGTRPLRGNGPPYSGMNVLLLWPEATERGYISPVWIIFKQTLEFGGAVLKGETGTTVIFSSTFLDADGPVIHAVGCPQVTR